MQISTFTYKCYEHLSVQSSSFVLQTVKASNRICIYGPRKYSIFAIYQYFHPNPRTRVENPFQVDGNASLISFWHNTFSSLQSFYISQEKGSKYQNSSVGATHTVMDCKRFIIPLMCCCWLLLVVFFFFSSKIYENILYS